MGERYRRHKPTQPDAGFDHPVSSSSNTLSKSLGRPGTNLTAAYGPKPNQAAGLAVVVLCLCICICFPTYRNRSGGLNNALFSSLQLAWAAYEKASFLALLATQTYAGFLPRREIAQQSKTETHINPSNILRPDYSSK